MMKVPQSVSDVLKKLRDAGFVAYVVGGSVRDMLMDKPTNDWDFTTNATPQQILDVFPDGFYNNDFGTVGVPIKNEIGETEEVFEITTFRSEKGYTNKRHPDEVVWGVSLEEDLARRDLTINAIAFDGEKIIDPFEGKKDLEEKIIRAVGDPHLRFQEDALRLIRAVRIATQLAFTIEEKTDEAILTHAPLLKEISADRIRHELLRILESKYPADGIMLLKKQGLLSVILPEVVAAFAIPQKSPKRHHKYDVGTHLVMSLHYCPSHDPVVRFATLLHDIGKPNVFKKDEQTELITFYNHEVVGAKIAENIAKRLNFSNKDIKKIVTLVRWHQFTVDEHQTDNTLRRFIRRVGKENLKDMLDLRIGDRLGGGAQEMSWRLKLFMKRLEEVQQQPFSLSDIKINGTDIMELLKIEPGPRIGNLLKQLFDEVVEGQTVNEHEALVSRLKEITSSSANQ